MSGDDGSGRKPKIVIGVLVTFVAIVITGLVTGAAQQVGAQLFNSACWGTFGDIRLGHCPVTNESPIPRPTPIPPDAPLIARVPEAIRETCRPTTLQGGKSALACRPADVVDEVTYRAYASALALEDAYIAILPPDLVSMGDCSVGPSDIATDRGRLGCYDSQIHGRIAVWTDEHALVLAFARSRGATYPELVAWVGTAGPVR